VGDLHAVLTLRALAVALTGRVSDTALLCSRLPQPASCSPTFSFFCLQRRQANKVRSPTRDLLAGGDRVALMMKAARVCRAETSTSCDDETDSDWEQAQTNSKIEGKRCGDGSCRYLKIRRLTGFSRYRIPPSGDLLTRQLLRDGCSSIPEGCLFTIGIKPVPARAAVHSDYPGHVVGDPSSR